MSKANDANGKSGAVAGTGGQDEISFSLTNDYVFRSIFGQRNVESLADFLAAVLGVPVEELGTLTVDDPHLFRKRKSGEGSKGSELDIRVHTAKGEIINIEVQLNPDAAFRERIVFLNARVFTEQMKRGDEYGVLNRTISVVITDFELIKENDCWHNCFGWYNIGDGTLLTDAQTINVLELPKLPEESDGTRLWAWLKLLKERRVEDMEAIVKGNKAMKDVVVTFREMSEEEAERRIAEAVETQRRDRRAEIEYGEKVGEERGRAAERLETAQRLKEAGAETALITKATGLTEKEIEAL